MRAIESERCVGVGAVREPLFLITFNKPGLLKSEDCVDEKIDRYDQEVSSGSRKMVRSWGRRIDIVLRTHEAVKDEGNLWPMKPSVGASAGSRAHSGCPWSVEEASSVSKPVSALSVRRELSGVDVHGAW